MPIAGVSGEGRRPAPVRPQEGPSSIEHYLRVLGRRWWVVAAVFALVSAGTAIYAARLKNIYTSETLIMVDPQKVPESYVKATVTGDVRNRLGTLSQQILSETRLQKIIEKFNLYPEQRKKLAREDVILKMRSDISVNVVSDFGASQDLQAFRIRYSGPDPQVVAQVTGDLAQSFIVENLKARTDQATGTTEFLSNQLAQTRKELEAQEARLRDFRLKHIGEMPEQQNADLQILGQLQAQLQTENDAVNRAEQQKTMVRSMMTQAAPVVDVDAPEERTAARSASPGPSAAEAALAANKRRLAALLSRYSEEHPDVRKLRAIIAQEEKEASPEPASAQTLAAEESARPASAPAPRKPVAPSTYTNPVLQAQLKSIEEESAKHHAEQQRLTRLIAGYQEKVNAIPMREQEVAALVRDYEMQKAHYAALLEKQLGAETATELEIRSKGEQFDILDPPLPAERPTSPNRLLIDLAGSLAGLMLGLVFAVGPELFSMSITQPQDVTGAGGVPVLEVIPVIRTFVDRTVRKRRILWGACSAAAAALACGVAMFFIYRNQV